MLSGVDLTLLHCVAAYPARYVNMARMLTLQEIHPQVGYSDHSTDVAIIPKLAYEMGAEVIEKHFSLDRVTGTPDREHSLNEAEFAIMVKAIHCLPLPESLGEGDMIKRHNRRLIVTEHVSPGDTYVEGKNFGAYRSLKDDAEALSPWLIDMVGGKIAKRQRAPGDALTRHDLDV